MYFENETEAKEQLERFKAGKADTVRFSYDDLFGKTLGKPPDMIEIARFTAAAMASFRRGDVVITTGEPGDTNEERKIKQVSCDTLTIGPKHWYHKLWRLIRSVASVAYWWCKVRLARRRVAKLERG